MRFTSLDNQLRADRPLIFGTEGNGVVLGRGWHPPEANFAWTAGPFAEISLAIEHEPGPCVVSFDCTPLVMRGARPCQVLIFVDGRLCATEVLHDRRSIEVVLNDGATNGDVIFWVPDIQSPHEIDPTVEDVRPLGIRVTSIMLKLFAGDASATSAVQGRKEI